MKANKIAPSRRVGLAATIAALILCALGGAALFGYGKLRDLYHEQCLITDMPRQVSITAGKMVHPSNIAECLGLKPGANLADIDFDRRRQELLAEVPNLRAIRIRRILPDRIVVESEERTPVARMGVKGSRQPTGLVVDTEGMVFAWQRGTQTLPIIREPNAPGTPKGRRITGRTLAALRLIEACREPDLGELAVLEVDVSKRDFLVATLSTYAKVKISWNEMDEQTPASRSDLLARLRNLVAAIRSNVAPDTVIWNATVPGRIFADTQKKP